MGESEGAVSACLIGYCWGFLIGLLGGIYFSRLWYRGGYGSGPRLAHEFRGPDDSCVYEGDGFMCGAVRRLHMTAGELERLRDRMA